MNDKELLERAAKAAGYDYRPENHCIIVDGIPGIWNPLTDDGDALRLAVKLGLSITPYPLYNNARHSVVVKQRRKKDILREANPTEVVEVYSGDPCAATRRAIVRAAAALVE